jgi:hypothetical protein
MNSIPVNNSTIGYLNDILFPHFLHRPLSRIKLKNGILSYHLMKFLHFGHAEGGLIMDFPDGIL